jgi:hypothetical protein
MHRAPLTWCVDLHSCRQDEDDHSLPPHVLGAHVYCLAHLGEEPQVCVSSSSSCWLPGAHRLAAEAASWVLGRLPGAVLGMLDPGHATYRRAVMDGTAMMGHGSQLIRGHSDGQTNTH